ncbi:MAG: DASH complex subunit ask1 [Watsoniomyces obsoletus]|nr:MAG: DASH complex subunit ask1 [Watsoniomyces obsoletus]
MKSPVEARSLSSLTTLASNPPKYPRNPTEETRKPLVLYIARVPGSRDVFLTTMKPREKVVTAEDVTSSLYYLHVDQASDGGSSFSESESQEIDRQMRYSSASDGERKVNRKPVPSDSSSVLAPSLPTRPRSATVPSELKEDTTWHGRNHSDEGLGSSSSSVGVDNVKAVRRKPVENASHVGSGSMQNVTTTMMMTGLEERRRQPLGPRPLPSRQGPPVYEHSGRENSRMTNFEPGPPLPPRKNVGGGIQPLTPLNPTSEPSFWGPDTPSPDRTPRQAQQDHHSPSRPPQNISSDLSSITLIRRDPSSGAQWNVGKMLVSSTRASSSSQSQNTSPSRHRRRSSPSTSSPPILIEILNPGYNKFLDSHKATTTGFSSSSTSNIATAAAAELRRISAISEYGLNNNERVFRRQIVGETVRSWFTTSRNKRRSGSERDMTDDGVGGGSASGGGTLLDPESTPRKGRYAYLSPWDGQCEFYTGASGRNLKVTFSPSP